ncbi:MAG: hypothetical protein HY805_07390 [Nitrospirae bacterium]|nr:hypothetical protein [Nitrospirota bacterium]
MLKIKGILVLAMLFVTLPLQAEVIERVSAFIDDEAITLSELEDAYRKTVKLKPDISYEEVLNTLINRSLILMDARRLRLEAESDEAVIEQYIDLKVRAFVNISENEIEDFFNKNKAEFKGLKLKDVREKIEVYLEEKEVNEKLKSQIEKLKEGVYIKIIYYPVQ